MRTPKIGRKAARVLVLRRLDARLETFRPVDQAAFAPFFGLREGPLEAVSRCRVGYEARVAKATPLSPEYWVIRAFNTRQGPKHTSPPIREADSRSRKPVLPNLSDRVSGLTPESPGLCPAC